ncbi:MAG: tripartite tricarboxylate transporter TctB family protein, partial [Deltaproteobacteria bacterium]|nr:tripartite tricarboxylate transporter TctB family protein [Deltaproteobacteria bacterium]
KARGGAVMKENKRGELIPALFFLTFFVGLTLISMTYSPQARRLPLIVAIPGIVLSAAQVLRETRRLRAPAAVETGEGNNSGPADIAGPHAKKTLPVMMGWMALLVTMIWILGFLITIPVYTILYMKSMRESWRLSIIFAISGFAILYLLFVVCLNMELYPGLIFQ